MSCRRGIYHCRKADLDDVAEGRTTAVDCVLYDESAGMLTRETSGAKSQPAGWKARDGRLWFATAKGAVVVDPAKVLPTEIAPLVVIEQIWSNGQLIFNNAVGRSVSNGSDPPTPRSTRIKAIDHLKSKVSLPAGSGRVLEIQYAASTLLAPEKARFRHRMGGFEGAWSEAGERRTAHYTNLRPGDYRFQVLACDHRAIWSESAAAFQFQVAPYFYETWAFYGLSGLATALLMVGFYRWRLGEWRRVQCLQEQATVALERTRIARDIHDDLGANLTEIGLLSELASRELPSEHRASRHVRKIGAASAGISRSLEEIVWAITPQNDTLRSLLAFLRRYALQFLKEAGLQVTLSWPEDIRPQAVPAQLRHHLFRAMKEALRNVVQHARASQVHLRVRVENDRLVLEIEDNGCGFNLPEILGQSDGNGLRNLKDRSQALGGEFEIESRLGRGTTLRFSVELQDAPKSGA